MNPDDAIHEDSVEIFEDESPTVNPAYAEEMAERRRIVALQYAGQVSKNIDELLESASRIDKWLENGGE